MKDNILNENQKKLYEKIKDKNNFLDDKETCCEVLNNKAKESLICFELLKNELQLKNICPIVFCSDERRFESMIKSCFDELTYPEQIAQFLAQNRLDGVIRLFQEEKVLQTAPISAVLAACANELVEISEISKGNIDKDKPIYVDVAYAGLQALRLYFVSTMDKEFSIARAKSLVSANNAFNGIFYRYRSKDGRDFSFHNYYESSKTKVANILDFGKDPKDINMMTIPEDQITLEKIVGNKIAEELEEFVFDNGGSACMIRDRSEWEDTEVGQAVTNMPLVKINKHSNTNGLKDKVLGGDRGPLQGLKVLDLTHIIAGPACTRLLAEYGADVLLVRRKDLFSQEQSFSELDGWEGKNAIDLDLNNLESLKRIKELIKEADVLVYSYQNNALDKFGLSKKEILELNPNIIHSSIMCFSEEVWADRPGWAPLAEDITGLSIRNGSKDNPRKLNGVPLDYIPGLILALGTLEAIKRSKRDGGAYTVMTSLTRGAVWLHECTDMLGKERQSEYVSTWNSESLNFKIWEHLTVHKEGNATGDVGFPTSPIASLNLPDVSQNMAFYDKCEGFKK